MQDSLPDNKPVETPNGQPKRPANRATGPDAVTKNPFGYDAGVLAALEPLLARQRRWSAIPRTGELLIEQTRTAEGYYIFVYPFEGRAVNEVLAALVAWRLSRLRPLTFAITTSDYGFALLCDAPIPLTEALASGELLAEENLLDHVRESLNETELAKRRFREIASVAGLIFQGFPGKNITSRHLQASAQLLYDVFKQYDPTNPLLIQAHDETLRTLLQDGRLADTLRRLRQQRPVLTTPPFPSPLAFPLVVERLRETLSSEKLEDRIAKMQLQITRA